MKKIVLFGAGKTGAEALKHYGREQVIAFADNAKTGMFQGLPVWNMTQLQNKAADVNVVISSLYYYEEIITSLANAGIFEYEIYRNITVNESVDVALLSSFKDIHKGQRCFIIGTGPSLRMDDLEKLHNNNEICFGTNKIFLAFNGIRWRPSYYFVSDQLQAAQYAKEICEVPVKHKFVADVCEEFWDSQYSSDAIKYHLAHEHYKYTQPSFSTDISMCIFHGFTVSYESLQLAAYMGFREIYYLGVDYNYSGNTAESENHFHKNYMRKNEVFNTFEREKQLLAYQKAESFSREHGFRIYNATRGGKLEVFERVDFDSLF